MMEKDLIILGGGPGGYVAGIRAAQLGADVAIIEASRVGGTCLNHGCIPTKTLYRNAEILYNIKDAHEFGITIDNYSYDVSKMQERKSEVVNTLVGGIEQLLKANKIEVVDGYGSFVDKNTVKVQLADGGSRDITAKHIIIATGSEPIMPPIPGAGLDGVVTSKELLEFDSVPEKLLIVGGGVIGMEFACIFNALGTEVTVVEFQKEILSVFDKDLTKRLASSLKKKGINIATNSKVVEIKEAGSGLEIVVEGKKGEAVFPADQVLMAVGRKPVVGGLNLEAVGVDYSPKGICVDSSFKTTAENIYAIGDVNGIMMLAHAASHQGVTAVEMIIKGESHVNHEVVPSCVFIFPEVSGVGLTEANCKDKGIEYKSSKFAFAANGKALSLGESEGFVKVITDVEDKMIGMQIMGPHASDLIHEGAVAIANGLSVHDIGKTIHAHPTLGESILEASLGIVDEAIHMAPKKR